MSENFRRYIVEFIGTFFLVLTIGCMGYVSIDHTLAPVVIGAALMFMVYTGGPISGGHFNPAVTLAAMMRKALPGNQVFPYMLAQFLGGILAACAVNYFADGPSMPAIGFYLPALILAEFLFTFALCYVVLMTATRDEARGNSYFGLAIGSTLAAGVAAVGGTICLGAFNPAVALGLAFMSGCCMKLCLITIITNLIAGAFAAWVFRISTNEV